MQPREKTRHLLTLHCQQYPLLQIQDVLKYLHQSAFGCAHFVPSPDRIIQSICAEHNGRSPNIDPLAEPLDGPYSRVHLSCLNGGLRAETLGKLFFASAQAEPDGTQKLEQKLTIASELVSEGVLPFSPEAWNHAVVAWRADGFPALHHSDVFRTAYAPAYRVIANHFVSILPLLTELDRLLATQEQVVVAIEGGSASGKTTLGELLHTLYGCTVFHMDDFFLRPEQRTAERYAQVGGNIDWERFLEEVLLPLSKHESVHYRPFDCSTFTLAAPVTVTPKKLTVIEGAYSMHPKCADYYDLSVFLDISPQLQKQRIAVRNSPELAQRFYNEWIPLENTYFSQTKAKQRCDLSISVPDSL